MESVEPVSSKDLSGTISLPDVDSVTTTVPQILGSGVEETPKDNRLIGIIAWIFIGVGILIVLIVLLSGARSSSRRSISRKRYRRKPYRSKRKHLLDDKYYYRRNRYR